MSKKAVHHLMQIDFIHRCGCCGSDACTQIVVVVKRCHHNQKKNYLPQCLRINKEASNYI